MKFASYLILLVTIGSAFALPSTNVEEFPWNAALKATLNPEKIKSIQSFYNKLQSSGLQQRSMAEEDNAEEMTEMECINYHLDNINTINNKSGVEVRVCTQNFQKTIEALNKSALKVKNANDKSIASISKTLTSCEKLNNAENGLQCQADLKKYANDITNLSNSAKRELDEHNNNKQVASTTKSWCINESVTKANQQISVEHEQLMLC